MLLSDQGQQWKEDVVTQELWQKGELKKSCVSDFAAPRHAYMHNPVVPQHSCLTRDRAEPPLSHG